MDLPVALPTKGNEILFGIHVAGTRWGTRRYLDMNRLAEASEAA